MNGFQRRQYSGEQKSLLNISYQKDPNLNYQLSDPISQNPRSKNIRPDQSYNFVQQPEHRILNDPKFQENLHKFYAVNEPSLKETKERNLQQAARDPSFQKNANIFYAVNEPPPLKIQNGTQQSPQKYQGLSKYQNDAKFQENMNKFYAVNDPPLAQNRNRQNQQISSDQSFQKNLHAFYAVNDPPPQVRNASRSYQQGTYNQPTSNKILSDPKFQENLHKFYAVNEPSLTEQKERKFVLATKDPNFQKNLHAFYAVNDPPPITKKGGATNYQPVVQNPNVNNMAPKILVIADSSAPVRNQLGFYFRTRGIEEFDLFTSPGGAFAFQNNPGWIQSLSDYINFMSRSYSVKEINIFASLDTQANTKVFVQQTNDKRPHQAALMNLKDILERQLQVPYRVSGIIIDQRGAAEKVF